jgi:hypothetical protein
VFRDYSTCQGCNGSGITYAFSFVGIALICFIIFVFGFLGFFAFVYIVTAFRLATNPWVEDVEDMDFLLSPMYWIWLFSVNRKKWVKWNTVLCLIVTPFLLAMLGLNLSENQDVLVGWFIGVALTIPFGITWYHTFEKHFDWLM